MMFMSIIGLRKKTCNKNVFENRFFNKNMRLFLGIPIPDKVKQEIDSFSEKITGRFKRVEKKNLHITLKFIGEADKNKIVEKLQNFEFERFKASLGDLGFFPNKDYIKVAWIGIGKGNQRIIELYEKIGEILGKERNFVPHITIARVKARTNLNELDFNSDSEFLVDKIVLFSSELTPKGPIYKEELEISLL